MEHIVESLFVIVGSFTFRLVIYLLFVSLAFYFFWKRSGKTLERIRIYKNMPEKKQILQEFVGSLRTLVVWGIMTVPAYFIVKNAWQANHFDSAPFYIHASWFVLLVIVHDAYFYWMHRWMHSTKFYKHVHAYHHKSVRPTPWAIFSFDAPEAIIHFSIGYAFLLLVPCHILVPIAWFAFMVTFNILGHLGFEIFPKFFVHNRVLGLLNTPTHHAMHHRYVNVHYGLYFTYWDRLMGTEHPDYIETHDNVLDGQRL